VAKEKGLTLLIEGEAYNLCPQRVLLAPPHIDIKAANKVVEEYEKKSCYSISDETYDRLWKEYDKILSATN
jgi:hypothetical protein